MKVPQSGGKLIVLKNRIALQLEFFIWKFVVCGFFFFLFRLKISNFMWKFVVCNPICSYLVCFMFVEAASLASTILKQLLESLNCSGKVSKVSESSENKLCDMLESAGMVLVQSMKQLKRVCFQFSEGLSTTAQGFLEEFLNSWTFADDQYHPLSGAEASVTDTGGSCIPFYISVDKSLVVVELYVETFLDKTFERHRPGYLLGGKNSTARGEASGFLLNTLSFRRALLDHRQLAFSYQMNPQAAVQTLPNSTG